jgi:hypothetical protein
VNSEKSKSTGKGLNAVGAEVGAAVAVEATNAQLVGWAFW